MRTPFLQFHLPADFCGIAFIQTKRDHDRMFKGDNAEPWEPLIGQGVGTCWARFVAVFFILFSLLMLWFILFVAPGLEPVASQLEPLQSMI